MHLASGKPDGDDQPGGTARRMAQITMFLVALSVLGMAGTARASLGGDPNSITTDAARMAVRQHGMALVSGRPVHNLILANGGVVREYVSASGTVYAVSWHGPGKPDLRQLLGPHFQTLVADNPFNPRFARRPMTVNRANLKIVTSGHPGAFWGKAWLPDAAPAGFNPTTL